MSLLEAAIAANRFGLGARPGEIRAISADPRGWLKAQLAPEPAPPEPLSALPTTEAATEAFNAWLSSIGLSAASAVGLYDRRSGMAATGGGVAMGAPGLPAGVSIEQSFAHTLGPGYVQAVAARMEVAVSTERPFFERLVRFWGNHFTVSASKPSAFAIAGVFERDVVRPRCTGHFREMLLASCKHPGMLIYLDNYISVGPHSVIARNPALLPPYLREILKGLNENLGREILELHTLGVRSGYTQADVTSLARVITGWMVRQRGNAERGGPESRGADASPMFIFRPAAHEPGPQTLLGRTYAQTGLAQGEAALTDLARHPATARFIATKLVRHFVADEPPPAAVDRIAGVFRDTEGDLMAVSSALVDLPEAWEPGLQKFKPPEDYLASALRAMNGKPQLSGQQLVALLGRMGQRPFYAPGPDGWADISGEWIAPDAIWKRVEWADALAKGVADAKIAPVLVAREALGPTLTPTTLQAIALAESPAQGLALFLTAPEFQRR
jgi:uncharacterized protein (DUF1800 family)